MINGGSDVANNILSPRPLAALRRSLAGLRAAFDRMREKPSARPTPSSAPPGAFLAPYQPPLLATADVRRTSYPYGSNAPPDRTPIASFDNIHPLNGGNGPGDDGEGMWPTLLQGALELGGLNLLCLKVG